jgi:hypothetical protein|nr:MAG TPA: hypothetical protein [Caudoviricetes sp.]
MTKMNAHDVNEKSIGIDAAIANTTIHDCDDSTYEVHVSAATQHMLAQLRENFITGLNIYSLIESIILKYAESHATKEYLLVKSTRAYKQLNESTAKELGELRQLVEVLKKENEELRNELDGYRNKANVVEEPVTENDVENAPILVTAPNIEHSSEHTVTLSDEDVESIKGNGKVETIPSVTRADSVSDEQLYAWANKGKYISRPIVSPTIALEPLVKHPNPNGAGNGVFVSTGKPENNTAEKIHVTKYSEIEETKI